MLKQNPILRYFTIGLIHAVMYVLGIVLFPIYYTFNKTIAKHKIFFLWWFLNDDEEDYISNTYGDAGYRALRGFDYYNSSWLRKLYEAFIWMAIRNSHWNFRLHVLPPQIGTAYDIEIIYNNTYPITNGMTFCNMSIFGKQFARYYVNGTKYFRYSFTMKTPKWMQLLGFEAFWNVHSGWAAGRWIFKSRWFGSLK